MWNIIKALNYQIKRDNIMIYGFLLAFFVLLAPIAVGENAIGEITGSQYYVSMYSEGLPFILALLTLYITSRICGWDFNDKTVNYELLAGHSRRSVYLARVLLSLIWSVLGTLAVVLLPIGTITLLNGWGYSADAKDMAVRGLLSLLPLFRIVCVWIMLTFLLQNGFTALALGYTLYMIGILITLLLQESFQINWTIQLGSVNLIKLLTLTNYTSVYINGEDVMVYRTALAASEMYSTVLASLAVGFVCLGLGYVIFCRRDMS
ncbi:MAG: ABC transporter permease [Roseburia sp.]|nr:ABC transporter permease [Roseburia sp.]